MWGGCFFHDTATTEIYTLSLHDALPISAATGCEKFGDSSLVAAVAAGASSARLAKSISSDSRSADPHVRGITDASAFTAFEPLAAALTSLRDVRQHR